VPPTSFDLATAQAERSILPGELAAMIANYETAAPGDGAAH
jgi:hypothetical protein